MMSARDVGLPHVGLPEVVLLLRFALLLDLEEAIEGFVEGALLTLRIDREQGQHLHVLFE